MLGAGLMQALKAALPSLRFTGVGGRLMQAEGLESLFPMEELSIMGFTEILPHIPRMLQRLKQTSQRIALLRPQGVITIDSPGFAFRLAARLAARLKNDPGTQAIPRIHYVAPSVWAYKPKRALKTARLYDLLLALLPFEPPYFERHGLKTVFTGHPVAWETPDGDAASFRARHRLDAQKIILLLPGSRKSEVVRHLGIFLNAARQALPEHRPVILLPEHLQETVRADLPPEAVLVSPSEKHDAFSASACALSKSGTITLELAAHQVPAIVAHKVNALSAWMLRRMIQIPYVSLVNIVSAREILPEFLQERCRPDLLAEALLTLNIPERAQRQKEACQDALRLMRAGRTSPPSHVAAKAILERVFG